MDPQDLLQQAQTCCRPEARTSLSNKRASMSHPRSLCCSAVLRGRCLPIFLPGHFLSGLYSCFVFLPERAIISLHPGRDGVHIFKGRFFPNPMLGVKELVTVVWEPTGKKFPVYRRHYTIIFSRDDQRWRLYGR